jgi:hypothetical protein
MRQRPWLRNLAPASLVACALFSALLAPRAADASVSIALTVDDVARASTLVARVTPLATSSSWEDGRIVTTTRLRVDRTIAGRAADDARTVEVRTLGGVVDGVGQIVEGEASFSRSESSIVFLVPEGRARFHVVGRAQGQLVLGRSSAGAEIVRIGRVGELVARAVRPPEAPVRGQLVKALDGEAVEVAIASAASAWERTHAK